MLFIWAPKYQEEVKPGRWSHGPVHGLQHAVVHWSYLLGHLPHNKKYSELTYIQCAPSACKPRLGWLGFQSSTILLNCQAASVKFPLAQPSRWSTLYTIIGYENEGNSGQLGQTCEHSKYGKTLPYTEIWKWICITSRYVVFQAEIIMLK